MVIVLFSAKVDSKYNVQVSRIRCLFVFFKIGILEKVVLVHYAQFNDS